MRNLYLLVLVGILCGSCSSLFTAKKVECCEKKAACCYAQMCCLPRYAKDAGVEPKAFTTDIPVYGTAQDLEPPPGATITKPGLFARLNPFHASEEEQGQENKQGKTEEKSEKKKEDKGFFDRLLPF